MESRIILHQVSGRLNRYRVGTRRYRQIDLHRRRHRRPDLHVLSMLGKARGLHRHVIGIKRHVLETETPLTVRGRRPVKAGHRVVNLDTGIRHHRARLV